MPKKTPVTMIYLSKYAEKVNAVYQVEKGTADAKDIALRNDIARRLYQDESEDVRMECEDEVIKQIELKKAKYEASLAGLISDDVEDQEQ